MTAASFFPGCAFRLETAWRWGWVASFALSLYVHLAAFLVMVAVSLIYLLLSWLFLFLGAVAPSAPKPPEPASAPVFILVEHPEESEEVKRAKYEASVARHARDQSQETEAKKDAPESHGDSPVPAPDPGIALTSSRAGRESVTPSTPSPPSPPPAPAEPAPEPPAPAVAEPEPFSRPLPVPSPEPAARAEEEAVEVKTESEPAPRERTVPAAPMPTVPPAPVTPPSRPAPAFETVPIGNRAANEGRRPEESRDSAAKLKGNKAFETLRARYPEYMGAVWKKIDRQLHAAAAVRTRSYRTGEVMLAFGIAPDGTLTGVEVVEARAEMLAEKVIGETAVRSSAPFPPFTEEMKRDAALFGDIGLIIYFQ